MRTRQWHLEKRHEKFANMQKQMIEQKTDVTISHNVNLRRDPREAMQDYIKLIDVK